MTVKPNGNNEECETKTVILTRDQIGTDYSYTHEIIWKNAIGYLILHIAGVYGIIYLFIGEYKFATLLWGIALGYMSTEGMTVGAHRCYAHRSFKPKLPLHVLLLLLQTLAGQDSVIAWAQDHRLHHRYSDTDGDPKNSRRGIFFSHIGWLITKKHPLVNELRKKLNMSDLLSDPLVMFQKKYFYYLYFVIGFFIPVFIPVYFWNESWTAAILIAYFVRYMLQLNGTWLVNSAAHSWGTRPYDKNIHPAESWFISLISMGEGWHNYHHTFPWDYKAAESSKPFNFSATLIKFLEAIGLAYDLKAASPEMVERKIRQSGDGTHVKTRSLNTAVKEPLHSLNTNKMKDPDVELKVEGLQLLNEKDVPKI